MKKKREPTDEAQSRVSRSGRIVKKVPRFSEMELVGRKAKFGKWSTQDKEKLLVCLQRFPGVQYNPITIFRSIKNKPKAQVVEYMARLRRRTADHIEAIRKKQPPILTWFQVADEVTWLKDDEELHQIIPTLLGIHSKEANDMQETNPLLNFSNLYKYLRKLHKCEVLPKLTPAESVILLDCFQQLAGILRASDTESQSEFMRKQYHKYFRHLYFATSSMSERALRIPAQETKAKSKPATKSPAKPKPSQQGQRSGAKPVLKAELRKKQPKRKTKRGKPIDKSQEGDECQSSQADKDRSNELHETTAKELEKPQEGSEGQSSRVGQKRSNDIQGREDMGQDNNGEIDGVENTNGSPEETPIGVVDQDSNDIINIHDPSCDHNLDPDDPDFLAKFANLFSLGSLNPFDIPAELMNIRRRKAKGSRRVNDTDGSISTDREGQAEGQEVTDVDVEDHVSKDHETDVFADMQDVPGTSFSSNDRTQIVHSVHVDRSKGRGTSTNGMEEHNVHSLGLSNDHLIEVLSSHGQPRVSSAHQTGVSSINTSEVSSFHLHDVSSAIRPEVPIVHRPEVSSTHQPGVSSTIRPEVPIVHRPEVSSIHQPGVSSSHRLEVSSDNTSVMTNEMKLSSAMIE